MVARVHDEVFERVLAMKVLLLPQPLDRRTETQPDTLRAELEPLLMLPRLSIEGLMCIPPFAEEAEASRKYFVELRELRDALEKEFEVTLPQLSMGMTNDYSVAVEEGATLVRVGTAIFGERRRRNTDL